MSTWMIFRTIVRSMVRPHELTDCLGAAPVVPWEDQHAFALHLQRFRGNQNRAITGEVASEHTSDIEQRAAAAHQTLIVGAVADNITFGAQDGILQRDRIENPPPFGDASDS